MGNNKTENENRPVSIDLTSILPVGTKIKQVAASESFSMLLTGILFYEWSFTDWIDTGKLYGVGFNGAGQLGIGEIDPERFYYTTFVPVKSDAFNGSKVEHVVVGKYHSLCLTESNQLFGWGLGGGKTIPFL